MGSKQLRSKVFNAVGMATEEVGGHIPSAGDVGSACLCWLARSVNAGAIPRSTHSLHGGSMAHSRHATWESVSGSRGSRSQRLERGTVVVTTSSEECAISPVSKLAASMKSVISRGASWSWGTSSNESSTRPPPHSECGRRAHLSWTAPASAVVVSRSRFPAAARPSPSTCVKTGRAAQ